MEMHSHIRVSGRALKRWFIAQCIDSLLVGVMWLVGLLLLGVPWAPLWALLAAGFHFIPHIGSVLALFGPLCATLIEGNSWQGALYLLVLYAAVMLIDGLLIQPALMHRASKVPLWASIIVPVVLGYFFSVWGVLLSAPLLAVFFALRRHRAQSRELPPPVVILPPAHVAHHSREPHPPIIDA